MAPGYPQQDSTEEQYHRAISVISQSEPEYEPWPEWASEPDEYPEWALGPPQHRMPMPAAARQPSSRAGASCSAPETEEQRYREPEYEEWPEWASEPDEYPEWALPPQHHRGLVTFYYMPGDVEPETEEPRFDLLDRVLQMAAIWRRIQILRVEEWLLGIIAAKLMEYREHHHHELEHGHEDEIEGEDDDDEEEDNDDNEDDGQECDCEGECHCLENLGILPIIDEDDGGDEESEDVDDDDDDEWEADDDDEDFVFHVFLDPAQTDWIDEFFTCLEIVWYDTTSHRRRPDAEPLPAEPEIPATREASVDRNEHQESELLVGFSLVSTEFQAQVGGLGSSEDTRLDEGAVAETQIPAITTAGDNGNSENLPSVPVERSSIDTEVPASNPTSAPPPATDSAIDMTYAGTSSVSSVHSVSNHAEEEEEDDGYEADTEDIADKAEEEADNEGWIYTASSNSSLISLSSSNNGDEESQSLGRIEEQEDEEEDAEPNRDFSITGVLWYMVRPTVVGYWQVVPDLWREVRRMGIVDPE